MTNQSNKTYRVKLIARGRPGHAWARQTPGNSGRWGNCQFLFDLDEQEYDWLVVIDDVNRKLNAEPERLRCPPENTILVTTEPATITRYGKAFAAQFGQVLTSQEPDALPHKNRIYSHTGNLWFHGKTYDELADEALIKTASISTVCSAKQQKHTIHAQRYAFTQKLKAALPELDIFGHGVQYIEHKYEALSPYRFHLAIENHIAPHHWTEKLADPLLAGCVPIYYGCPNATDYFPPNSFIAIDINNEDEAIETIKAAITTAGEYEHRLEAVQEARRRVMHEYNLLSMLAERIEQAPETGATKTNTLLYGRKKMRLRSPSDLLAHIRWNLSK